MGLNVLLCNVITKQKYDDIESTDTAHWHISTIEIDDDYKKQRLLPFAEYVNNINTEFYDFAKIFKRRKLNIADYSISSYDSCGRHEFVLTSELEHARAESRPTKKSLCFTIKCNRSTPTYWENVPTLYVEYLYNMRKGANTSFYNDGCWDSGGYITTLAEATEHYIKYFKLEPNDRDNTFYTEVLSRFVEGKHVLLYG
jgi:hypothetical protein